MTYVNDFGYLERRSRSSKGSVRDWWLVQFGLTRASRGRIVLANNVTISVPKDLVGKRIRFKMEVLK